MNKDLLLGIDFGTGGCKVTLIDTGGNLIDSVSGEYNTSHPQPGYAEQNPADWHATMCTILRKLKHREKIAAVALDSYTHGAVLLDGKLNVIRPTIIWTDQRSVKECGFLKKNYFALIFNTAYQTPTPTWTLPQMLWLKNNEPENLKKVKHILFVKDYIRFLLTGEMACDCIESQGTLFWDMKNSCWSEELCALADISVKALPRIGRPTDIAGKLTAGAALETGLPEGIPVIMGASDSAVEDYASGAIESGQCILKLATAGNVNVMTSNAHPHPETLTYSHVVPGMWYTVTATNAAAACQRWFRDNFCTPETTYQELNQLAAKSPPGSGGVFFHPYLMGERSPYWDPFLRGSFTGLSMGSCKADLSRALLEGVAFSLRDCYSTIEKMGLETHEFILIGGGAKNELWCRIISDVFNAPVKCPSICDASFGSALLAGVGTGVFPDEISAVRQCLKFDRKILPDADNAEFYAKQFRHYRNIHDELAGVYRNINNKDME
ncbi:MAG: Xylulokinase [Candidatus Uhrbacteria bacterium GW2011_GWF2_39_13]|uniref:Xylulose kinase n=1 Tax=Candidatus Uhrbacteria bacterium GW2011_GWF2_39_13 TaxID=1618995 RepID=A0A0G0MWB8_9BACT|nr:MAG: Xylulokinase [Candidatus Uhrbacteria bacterium GW2011_GWF2_39_13]